MLFSGRRFPSGLLARLSRGVHIYSYPLTPTTGYSTRNTAVLIIHLSITILIVRLPITTRNDSDRGVSTPNNYPYAGENDRLQNMRKTCNAVTNFL